MEMVRGIPLKDILQTMLERFKTHGREIGRFTAEDNLNKMCLAGAALTAVGLSRNMYGLLENEGKEVADAVANALGVPANSYDMQHGLCNFNNTTGDDEVNARLQGAINGLN